MIEKRKEIWDSLVNRINWLESLVRCSSIEGYRLEVKLDPDLDHYEARVFVQPRFCLDEVASKIHLDIRAYERSRQVAQAERFPAEAS